MLCTRIRNATGERDRWPVKAQRVKAQRVEAQPVKEAGPKRPQATKAAIAR